MASPALNPVPACTKKKWAKPAWATVAATGNFAPATRTAPIIIAGMGMKSIEAGFSS
jgi:hypothetical protein